MARIFLSRYSLAVYSVVITIAFVLVAVVPYVQVSWYKNTRHVVLAQANASPNLGCGDVDSYNGYSLAYKAPTSPWATTFMMNSITITETSSPTKSNSTGINQLTDINGDGLPDYVHSSHTKIYVTNVGYTRDIQDCVYLNTGNGWQKAYGCIIKYTPNPSPAHYRYYGDCAA